ncbi:DUF6323 family protein [Paenibacillus sp. 1001270B_150601_E10]|uniref:DUF6323 family protein n=1 Tax=Paenibacillus sp. 1001270B_150601_E10 TaxID=2787079 RepID=UPI00189E8FD1|nr:DUF6323 family protein [Paenibacillus sp. 1001270B_150601_E10]
MYLSRLFNSLYGPMHEQVAHEMLALNERTKEFGLTLSLEDIQAMIAARSQVLSHHGRVELSFEVTKELILSFSESSFIEQEYYADTLNELQEMFYYLKNETEDQIRDTDLLIKMKNLFEEECEGSIELLRSRLEEFAEKFRSDMLKYESRDEGGED